MGDKKKWIDELLQSQEMHEYFQKMLDTQTQILLEQMCCQQNECDKEEVERIKWEYDREKKKRNGLEEECKKLQGILEEENDKRKSIEGELKTAIEENKKLQSLYECVREKKEDIEKKFSIYETRYRKIDEAYSTYVRLSQEAKNRLKNVFKTDSIYGFIAASVEWRNVEGLWNFAKRHIVEKETEDTEELIYLFEFILQSYNFQASEKKYELLVPAIGDKFDSDRHTIIGIKTDGFVSKVRLSGIIDRDSAKVIQKALIEV